MLYQKLITEATGETNPAMLAEIEDTMRNDIVHSTLDWLSKAQFVQAAKEAVELLEAIGFEA